MTIEEAGKQIKKYYLHQRRLPSIQELSDVLGVTKRAGAKWANKLVESGLLGKDEKGKLFPQGLFQIPTLGIIKAGYPTVADPLSDQSIDLYNYILEMPGQIFSLIVRGDSMIDDGIHDGDIAIVEKGREAYNGDVVAAIVDNEWTLKSFFRRDGQIVLVPGNPNYPVIHPKHSLQIGGVVISVIRKYH